MPLPANADLSNVLSPPNGGPGMMRMRLNISDVATPEFCGPTHPRLLKEVALRMAKFGWTLATF